MREYKFYIIAKDGHMSGPATARELPDDQSAIREASVAAVSADIEIWQGGRMVAYVVADETKQTPPPKGPGFDQHK